MVEEVLDLTRVPSHSPTPIVIRAATPDEAGTIADLVVRAYEKYIVRIGRRPEPMDDDYGTLIAAREVFVVDRGGLAGVIVLRAGNDHLLVENVAVDPNRQGEGLGRSLLEFAEHQARAQGFKQLQLYTNEAMTENIRLYSRLGWQETMRRTEHGYARVYFKRQLA